jgi:hypothetical protein
MTVETELPVRDARHDSTADASDAAELLRTMAAVVRTVFGVALQAPSDAHHEQPHEQPGAQVESAPVSVALPPEMPSSIAMPAEAPTLVAVPEAPVSIPLTMPAPAAEVAPQEPVGLTVVPDPEPTLSAPSVELPSISLGEGGWPPPQTMSVPTVVIPEFSPPEPPAVHSAPPSIPVPTYVAPVAPIAPFAAEPPADRHSMALLHEIAFLDD